jgi:hypothetical protein
MHYTYRLILPAGAFTPFTTLGPSTIFTPDVCLSIHLIFYICMGTLEIVTSHHTHNHSSNSLYTGALHLILYFCFI